MKRRSFLQLVAAAPLIPLAARLPALAPAGPAAEFIADDIAFFGGPSQVAEFRTNYTDAIVSYYREKYGVSIEAPILQCDVDWARSQIDHQP